MKSSVCIIMATYNGEKYLGEQLDSIIAQTYKDWMLFVSDDGSTDQTMKILKSYQKKLGKDKMIIIKNTEKRHGAKYNFVHAINRVLEKGARADYYFFSDQDDVWEKKKIEHQVKKLKALGKGPNLVYCEAKIVDEKLKPIGDETLSEKFTKMPEEYTLERSLFVCRTAGCTVGITRELLEMARDVNPDKIWMHDFYVLLLALTFGKVAFLDEPLNLYRQHAEQYLGTREEHSNLVEKFKKLFNKELHEKWHEENLLYYGQAEEILAKGFTGEKLSILEKFVEISRYKSGLHRVVSFYLHRYRTKDWWTIGEKGF